MLSKPNAAIVGKLNGKDVEMNIHPCLIEPSMSCGLVSGKF